MEIGQEEKNYYRILLRDVSEFGLDKPIVLAGKYKYDTGYNYATFTNVRILLSPPYSKTKIICDHLNLLQKEISSFYLLGEKDNKKKFYFVGYPAQYTTNGSTRYGFRLSKEISFASFGLLSTRERFQNKIDKECADLFDWVQDNISENNIGILRKEFKNGKSI